jgi:hypothetical protein
MVSESLLVWLRPARGSRCKQGSGGFDCFVWRWVATSVDLAVIGAIVVSADCPRWKVVLGWEITRSDAGATFLLI